MARTTRNYTRFEADVMGKHYEFKCWYTPGSHHCEDQDGTRTRYTFGNRPWESFQYETVLSMAINKYPAEHRAELEEIILHRTREAEKKAADEQFERFKNLHAGLSDQNKELMKSYPTLESEEDVNLCMGFMGLLTLMQG